MLGRRKFRTREARRREQKRLLRVYGVAFAGALMLLGLIAYGLQWQGLRIQSVAVDTDGAISTDEVTALL